MDVKCEFDYRFNSNVLGAHYVCLVKSASITQPNTIIKSIQGKHMAGIKNNTINTMSNAYVTKIFLGETNIIKYFPNGLHKIFPNLTGLYIWGCKLKGITRESLIGLETLREINVEGNLLTSLPDDLFQGMRKLKRVSFNDNKLKRLSSKLLKPLLVNKVEYVGFRDNIKINSFYDAQGEQGSTNSLEELMNIIDRNCEILTFNHEQSAKVGIKELWMSGRFSDFTIIAGLQSFKVHKNILAIHSSVFMAMLNNDNEETREGKIIIKDFNSEVVEEFLRYIYTGEIIDATNAMDLFAIAAKYDVLGLKSEYEKMILKNLNATNALEVLNLGNLYGSENMKKLAFVELKEMFPEHEIPDVMINQPERLKDVVEIQRALQSELRKIAE